MKNYLTILTIFLAIYSITKSKELPRVSFEKQDQRILEPSIGEKKVSVKVVAVDGDEDKYPIRFKIRKPENSSANNDDFSFNEDTEFQIDSKNGFALIWITLKVDDKFESEETIVLELAADTSYERGEINTHILYLEDIPSKNDIRLSTGVGFDFKSVNEKISFYGEVLGFIPDQFSDNLGFSFRIFSYEFNEIDSISNPLPIDKKTGSSFLIAEDTLLPVENIEYTRREIINTRISGLNMGYLLNIYQSENSTLYFSGILESSITNVTTELNYEIDTIGFDTIPIHKYDERLESFDGDSYKRDDALFTFTVFPSFIYRYNSSKYDIRLSPGIGVYIPVSDNPIFERVRNFNIASYLQVNVMDKSAGLTIGGEIKTNPTRGLPLLNIFVAKSFELSSFATF